ncbi:MAG: 1,4-alpha-glucan branching protein GlgB [Pyrinomonadaceae bacterium]
MVKPRSTVPVTELRALLNLNHTSPHSVLGIHVLPDRIAVRAYMPDAEAVTLLRDGVSDTMLSRVHEAGCFEVLLPGEAEAFTYRLRVTYPGGAEVTIRDPYAFLPTVGTMDEHLFSEGTHEKLYDVLGSHVRGYGSVTGVSFAVWAPNADSVSVVGNFNNWDGRVHQMRRLGTSGIWEIYIPDLPAGVLYKYEIRHQGKALPDLKADPFAFFSEVPPATSSIVFDSQYQFNDGEWLRRRGSEDHRRQPMSIYEVHVGSWRRLDDNGHLRPLTYRELAHSLADYVNDLGFTHVEFLPLKGHPYGGSWGYQVSSYYAATARYGTPDDFRYLVDFLHQRGIGVIMDWVPAHFPKDAWALGRFDGTALYEHQDPRKGEHPDWGTYIFNYGRKEVKNFLIANALFWIRECHIDGLRVDAVASMLYLDYSRTEGGWVPNQFGGRENLEAIDFIRDLNAIVRRDHPGVMMIAEESTSWPKVSWPIDEAGLGFDFKWNMGWMHDTLKYFAQDALFRKNVHQCLTFGLVYAWSENFVLPLSHDEVVHLKGSLINKMHGDRWQKFANLRALYAHMWAHPGKKLLFMGGELAQRREWSDEQSLDWHLLEEADHQGVQNLVRDLNRIYRDQPALWDGDTRPEGFCWLDVNSADDNIIAFLRRTMDGQRKLVSISNFAPIARAGRRVGLPEPGFYRQILNTDSGVYGGSGEGATTGVQAESLPWQGQPFSALIDLPPLATMWFQAP